MHDSITTPVVQTSTYTFRDTAALVEYMEERMFWDTPQREEYGRYGNPTVRAVEARLAALEGGDDAVLTPSGMSAITGTLLVYLSAGSHLILTGDCYRRTRDFVHGFLTRYGIEVTVTPAGDLDAVEAAIRPTTRLIFSESPTNPFMRCLDLARLGEIGRRRRVRTAIDSTFATPLNLKPLDYGIDLVIHSVTKYLAGHNDVLAGVVIGKDGLTVPLRQMQGVLGSVVDPQAAFLVGRGLKTLGLRVERQNANGLAVARFLEKPSQRAAGLVPRPAQPPGASHCQQRRCAASAAWSPSRSTATAPRPAASSMPCACPTSAPAWAASKAWWSRSPWSAISTPTRRSWRRWASRRPCPALLRHRGYGGFDCGFGAGVGK